MGTHNIGFRCGQLRIRVLGINILRCPDNCLADRHTKKILPTNSFLMWILKCLLGDHSNRATAIGHFLEKSMITQARWHENPVHIVTNQFLGIFIPLRFVLLAVRIQNMGFQMKKVGTYRSVSICGTGQHNAIFHLRHFCAHLNRQTIG